MKPGYRLALILLYMGLIFGVVIAMAKYAEHHPIEDHRKHPS